jgi:hypothetical protein
MQIGDLAALIRASSGRTTGSRHLGREKRPESGVSRSGKAAGTSYAFSCVLLRSNFYVVEPNSTL